jgi:N-acetylglutamate synthase-like GNAT family acetyltransferase
MDNFQYSFKVLGINDLNNDILDRFNRFQKVNKIYAKENGQWIVKEHAYIEDWDKKRKVEKINSDFYNAIISGAYVIAAYNENSIIGFAVLLNRKFGTQNQYIQLQDIHVSYEYRNNGIGKKLFANCIEKAKEIGAKKIYISANSSEETQCFYKNIGCIDAEEINEVLAQDEPFDRQMEYIII